MLFYWIIFIILFALAFSSNNKTWKINYKIAFWLLLILGATRAVTVGNDLHGGYSAEFKVMGEEPSTWGSVMPQFEYCFFWLMAFWKFHIGTSTGLQFFQFLFAVTFSCYAYYIWKNSRRPATVLFFMFALANYFSLYNTMRQNFAFSLILIALLLVDKYKNNERKGYILFTIATVLISLAFHRSQVILLVLIPIFVWYNKISTKIMVISLVVSSIASYTLAKFSFSILSQMSYLLADSSSNFYNYMNDLDNAGEYSQVSNILNTIFCIYVVYCSRHSKDRYLVAYVLGIILLNILTPISGIYERIAASFIFFRIFVYTRLWYTIPNRIERNIFRIGMLAYCVIMFQNRLINDNYEDVLPYINAYFNF